AMVPGVCWGRWWRECRSGGIWRSGVEHSGMEVTGCGRNFRT
nr:hypothetical protein [Tanacetum cinerariifolium]